MQHLLHLQHQPLLHQLLQRQAQLRQVFLDLETTRLRQAREWVSHAQWLAQRATTHSLQAAVQDSVLVAHVQPVPAVRVVRVAHHVRVAHRVQVSAAVMPVVAHRVQVSVAAHQVPVVLVSVAHVRLVAQQVVAVVTVAELQVLSVRVEAVELPRLVSRSVRNVKSSNREWLQALVAQLCHVAMEPRCFVCAAVPAFKTSQTRLKPLQLS